MRLIGDIHGNFRTYHHIATCSNNSIQLGDFGIGFNPKIDNLYQQLPNLNNHFFIRGNHDNPNECKKYLNCLYSFGFHNEFFYISGAYSIDTYLRVMGVNVWEDEELSHNELTSAIALFESSKPDLVCSHECPETIREILFNKMNLDGVRCNTRTGKAMNEMLNLHSPSIWIFAHYHPSKVISFTFKNTKFICLPIEGFIDI